MGSEDEKVGFVQCFKRLLATRAYKIIPKNEVNYDEMRRLLLSNFGCKKSSTSLQLELRKMTREPFETVDAFYNRVLAFQEDLVQIENAKYPIEVRTLMRKTLEHQALQHFEAGLLPAIQNAIAIGRFRSLEEARDAAREREEVLQYRNVEQCQVCNPHSNCVKNCSVASNIRPTSQQCPYRGELGHFVVDCPLFNSLNAQMSNNQTFNQRMNNTQR